MINSKNGQILWNHENSYSQGVTELNIYTPAYIPDQNNDTIPDIIAAHSEEGDSEQSRIGHLIIISGKDGTNLKKIDVPDQKETFYMPQIYNHREEGYSVIFGTGSPMTAGSLNVISLENLFKGNMV